VLTGNAIIIMAIVKHKYHSNFLSSHNPANPSHRHIANLTATLIVVSVAFVLFTLPSKLYAIATRGAELNSDYLGLVSVALALGKLSDINNGANFYLYCMTGQRFRTKLVSFIARCCHRNT